MSKCNVRKQVMDQKTRNSKKEKEEKPIIISSKSFLYKHLKRVYPLGLHHHKNNNSSSFSLLSSSSSLSSSPLTLSSQSSLNDSSSFSAGGGSIIFSPSNLLSERKIKIPIIPVFRRQPQPEKKKHEVSSTLDLGGNGPGELKRCNWITKNSDKLYVQFHDQCWGVPVYEDNQLFELLAMTGMLMDYNWTEILKRKGLLRENFAGFDPNIVAKMGEEEIMEISSNKTLMLAESRVRSIVDNAKCILKIMKECGSFGNYLWGYVNYKPVISRYKYPRNVPLRTPKAEAMSKDLLKRGFRLVGPVIVCSFMQATGMTIDHLVDCFRFSECVSHAERPWRHV